jgi:hypothetical protein
MTGWRVLRNLLAQEGLMKIALYSRLARETINRGRQLASERAPAATAAEMRALRRAILELPDGHVLHELTLLNDFYSLHEFRDLVLHVQERQFTLPEIADCMAQLDLRLLSLESHEAARAAFQQMHPGRDARRDLSAWDDVERAHPKTFIGMYTFWCCEAQSRT